MCQNTSGAIGHLIKRSIVLPTQRPFQKLGSVTMPSSKIPTFSQTFKAALHEYFIDKAIAEWMATSSENVSIH